MIWKDSCADQSSSQNTNTCMLFLDVNMDDPRNQHPVPQLEDNEYIECFTLPLAGLWEELARLEGEGFAIDARVATVAQGMELASRYKDAVLG